jgi:hypothetical protein
MYEVACYDRVRQLVFAVAELAPAAMSAAHAEKIEWGTLGPTAVLLVDHLIVAWPLRWTGRTSTCPDRHRFAQSWSSLSRTWYREPDRPAFPR